MSGNYHRVIPRDLFKEAAMLKALGRVALAHVDGMLDPEFSMDLEDPCSGFAVSLSPDGTRTCPNLVASLAGEPVEFFMMESSSKNPPLYFLFQGTEGEVFDASGKDFSEDFVRLFFRVKDEGEPMLVHVVNRVPLPDPPKTYLVRDFIRLDGTLPEELEGRWMGEPCYAVRNPSLDRETIEFVALRPPGGECRDEHGNVFKVTEWTSGPGEYCTGKAMRYTGA